MKQSEENTVNSRIQQFVVVYNYSRTTNMYQPNNLLYDPYVQRLNSSFVKITVIQVINYFLK